MTLHLPEWLRRKPADPVFTIGTGSTARTLPIEIRRLAHARRLTLRLAPDGSAIRITIPHWAPTREALAFVHSRADWLAAQLAAAPVPAPLTPGEAIHWRGARLTLLHVPHGRRGVRVTSQALEVGGPAESLSPRMRRWMQAEARALFQADLAEYAPRAGVPIRALALSNARRRWGSCSAKGIVRLNWRLVMAPDEVRRSVVAHEVAHLVHFDHSPRFHGLLASLFEGDIAAANRWLARHGRELYAPLG